MHFQLLHIHLSNPSTSSASQLTSNTKASFFPWDRSISETSSELSEWERKRRDLWRGSGIGEPMISSTTSYRMGGERFSCVFERGTGGSNKIKYKSFEIHLMYICTYRRVDFMQFFVFSNGVIDFLLHIGEMLFVCDVTGSFSRNMDSSRTG